MKSSIVGLLFAGATLTACGAPPTTLIVRAGRLVDGMGGPARDHMRVIVRDGIIQAIESDSDALPEGDAVEIIDARGLTVMPGLIDVHTHLLSAPSCTKGLGVGIGQGVRNLRHLLRAGVTTVADLGAPPAVSLGVRDYVAAEADRGPRVLIAGPVLTAPKGYPYELFGDEGVEIGALRFIDGAENARAVVKELAEADVDLIKVALQGRSFADEKLPQLDEATLKAIVETAHADNLRVVAHAIRAQEYELALRCGVDGLVHGALEPLSPELIDALKAAHTTVAPTHFVFDALQWGPQHIEIFDESDVRALLTDEVHSDLHAYAEAFAKSGDTLPPFLVKNSAKAALRLGVEEIAKNTKALHAGGVTLAFGTDGSLCYNILGRPIEELRRFRALDIPAADIIRIATHQSALALGMDEHIGTLEVGKRADMIAVDGNPDEDIEALTRVRRVVLNGKAQNIADEGGVFSTVGLFGHILGEYISY